MALSRHERHSVVLVRPISARRYQRIVGISFVLLVLIILTGAAVRLTQSGLGCDNWPKCTESSLTPEWALHGWIEFGNRLLTIVIGFAVIGAALGAYRRVPTRPDLRPYALGLVAGVGIQGVLGGITVRVDLHPLFVGLHYLLSIVLLWNAILLWQKARTGPGKPTPLVDKQVLNLSRATLAMATLVLVVGTLVTGTGPNSGDAEAERLSFSLRSISRVHSLTAWALVALVAALAWRLRTGVRPRSDAVSLEWLMAACIAQGGLGYWQYFAGVPPLLVEVHVAGSVVVWCLTLLIHLSLFAWPEETAEPEEKRSDSDWERQ